MLSDIEISRNAKIQPIKDIAAKLDLDGENDIDLYGKYKAKINENCYEKISKGSHRGKLILVTAINPTPFGEGKTTMSIGLGQALAKLGHKTMIALREPSLGPVFGMKGGAAGGGYSQAIPMEDINLHFTGDFHAITSANNLLCAMIDNHIHQGNELKIDPEKVTFKRCMDMNDRSLREIEIGLGKKANGVQRKDGFNITAASEIMAIFCLAEDLPELKKMLGDITIGYTFDDVPVYAKQLRAEGAMCSLLRDAFSPNLVQTLEGVPVLIHGCAFANIAHGCNSARATITAQKIADYAVTEAGFGADLGAEKFLDIKCRKTGLVPDAAVVVATIRALKHNGGVEKENLTDNNPEAVETGFANLIAHVENIKKFGIKPIIAINKFIKDTAEEIEKLCELCEKNNIPFSLSTAFEDGGDGSLDLAKKITELCDNNLHKKINFAYDLSDSTKEKIEKLAKNIYGADGVKYSEEAEASIERIAALGCDNLPICVAKTQYSFSDNAKLLNRPTGFKLKIKDVVLQTGAGFLVVLAGSVMTMPGLPKIPSAEIIDVSDSGEILNLS